MRRTFAGAPEARICAQLLEVHERDALAVLAQRARRRDRSRPASRCRAAPPPRGTRARRRASRRPRARAATRRAGRRHTVPSSRGVAIESTLSPDQRLERRALGRDQEHVDLVARELLDHLAELVRLTQLRGRHRDRERLAVELLEVEALLRERSGLRWADRGGAQPVLLPTIETKLTQRPGAPPRLWVRPSFGRLDLARAGLAAQLEPHLVHHAQAARADRVAEALEAAVRVDRLRAVEVEAARRARPSRPGRAARSPCPPSARARSA